MKACILIIMLLSLPISAGAVEQDAAADSNGSSDIFLPTGDLFRPLLADPKQPRFFVSLRKYNFKADNINGAAVGYGENFGIYKHQGKENESSYQLNIVGGLFAQFNLDAPSRDLLNADYTIGFPLTYRNGPVSARLNVYHQSSHLGDEYLLQAKPERINLSYESIDLLGSYEWEKWRSYIGGEYLFRKEPGDLEPAGVHGGIEYYGTKHVLKIGRLVGGLDLKSYEEHRWSLDAALNIGFEFGQPNPGQRRLRIMLEGYKGYSPHGQFYNDRISYYGVGLYLGF